MIRVVSCLVILGRNHFFVPLLPELRLCHFLTFHSTNLLFWTLTGCCSWYKFFPLSSGITLSYFHHRFQHRNHCQKVWFLSCTETKYQSELLVKLWTLCCLISFIQLTFLKVIFTSTTRRQRKLSNRQHSPKLNYKGFADRCHMINSTYMKVNFFIVSCSWLTSINWICKWCVVNSHLLIWERLYQEIHMSSKVK